MKRVTLQIIGMACMLLLHDSCKKSDYGNSGIIETGPAVLEAHMVKISDQIPGFYSALPAHYAETKQSYPLLVWLHGNGQVGNGNTDLPRILFGGIPKLLDDKKFPPSFTVNNRQYSFIVLMPQFTSWPGNEQIQALLQYAKDNYRIDQSRIYLTGISMGGIVTADMGAAYPQELAAIVPLSGVSIAGDIKKKCSDIATARLPVWIFQNTGDDVFNPDNARSYVTLLNSFKPVIRARYTELLPYGENGHDAWTTATNPAYREDGMNIYEWILQFTRER